MTILLCIFCFLAGAYLATATCMFFLLLESFKTGDLEEIISYAERALKELKELRDI